MRSGSDRLRAFEERFCPLNDRNVDHFAIDCE